MTAAGRRAPAATAASPPPMLWPTTPARGPKRPANGPPALALAAAAQARICMDASWEASKLSSSQVAHT